VSIGALIAANPCLLRAQLPRQSADSQAPQPTAAMPALIKAFEGHWSLQLKVEPSKDAPHGLDGTGEETWHAGPAGLTLTDEEIFAAGSDTVIVVGMFWRDPKTTVLHALDCSNEIPVTCDLKGALDDVTVRWTGSELTVDEKEISRGQVMTSRVSWSDITANTFTETGYIAPAGGSFTKVMTIHATRAAAK
jgi:hypothetical protein